MPQAQLDRFGSVEERPADEAVAIAGEDRPTAETVVVSEDMGQADGTVAFAVHQVNYTLEQQGGDEEPLIHLFGRDEDGSAVTVTVRGFTPYFYAPTDSVSPGDLDDSSILDTEDGFRSIRDEELTRIYARTPRDVGNIRDRFTHFEADVPFPSRFLIDKGIRSGVVVPRRERNGHIVVDESEVEPFDMHVEPRVHMMDIEVDDRSGFPEDGEEPIISISAHDSYRDEYVVWLYAAPNGDAQIPTSLDGHELLDDGATTEIRTFEGEAAMLDDYLAYVEETDPDLISGWNVDDFDAPYLLDRMERLDRGTNHDLSIERLSRVDEVWRDNWRGPNIKGRVVFDLLYGYQRTQFSELDSYRLDAVGEEELGTRKEVYTGSIGDLWEEDPERLLEYNLRDVELCVEIDRKQEVIAFWNEVRTFVGCKLEDAPTPGDAVDVYVLHKVHGDFVLPSKGQVESEDYEGGAVFDPITGVREMVSVLDLKSLYPMCMVTVNASPETKVDPDQYDGETFRAPNGTHFRKEPDGIIREMVDELLREREQKKARRNEHEPSTSAYERFDQQQAAVKVIMNCFTPDTDVLTPTGIRNIRELDVGDPVYSLDPDSMTMEVKPVVETHAYPEYRGEVVDIQTSNIDFRITPNHRMLVRENDNNNITEDRWEFVQAGELYDDCHYEVPHDWSYDHGDELTTVDLTTRVEGDYEVCVRPSVDGHTFTAELGWSPPIVGRNDLGVEGYVLTAEEFRGHRSYIDSVCERSFVHAEANREWIPRTFDGDDFLGLLAWYITEGILYTSESQYFGEQYRGSSTTVKITQNEPAITDGGTDHHHTQIGELLDRMGFDYDVDGRSYQFTSKVFGAYLRRTCGKHNEEKRIPEFVYNCSERQKRMFLEILIAGDGNFQENSWRFTTTSTQLRDDVMRLCVELGLSPSYGNDSGCWRICCTEGGKNTFRPYRTATRSTAEEGVYCVSVKDNQTLLAGRNGTFQHVGNSVYGVLGWDRFRLYDREMGAAVTATGREVLEFTEEQTQELGEEVIYGDSITGDRPVVVRDPMGIVRLIPIETLFERATASIGHEEVITADGGTAWNDPPEKDRRSLIGWEALSLADNAEPEWQSIEQVIRHKTDKEVVKLQHKFGESVTTCDHSFVVEEEGNYIEAAPNDVDQPLRIPGLPDVEIVDMIDVYEVLEGYERRYKDGRSVGLERAKPKVKRVHANEEYVWFGHEHHGDLDSTIKVQRYIDLDSKDGDALLRLLAAYVTEGSASTVETTESKFGASISESRHAWLQGIREDYERLFENVTTSIIDSDSRYERTVTYETQRTATSVKYDDQTKKLQMMNELTAVFFREFAGQGSRGKRIPGFVFNIGDKKQQLFLDILVEGDGSREFPRYSDEYCERNFDYETTSRELAAGLSMLLTQRDEKHSLKYRDEKNSYTVRTCDYYRTGRDPIVTEVDHDGYVYDLSVAENDNFVDAVGGIVLHNTDSVMMSLGGENSKADAINLARDIEEHINDSYNDFARTSLNATSHRFQIEFEKLYRRFFQAGKKKRYAGHVVWSEGKDVDDVDIVGFEYQRSDIAQITKEVQREVIDLIVTGEDLEADLEEVRIYLGDIIEGFLEGEIDVDAIGIPGGIGKRLDNYETDTAHVRGAKYANTLLGTNFNRGSKPKRYYLEGVHPQFFREIEEREGLDPRRDSVYGAFKQDPDVICVEFAHQIPDDFEIDHEKMLDKTLKGPISRILEALDMSWEEIKSGQEQTGLSQF